MSLCSNAQWEGRQRTVNTCSCALREESKYQSDCQASRHQAVIIIMKLNDGGNVQSHQIRQNDRIKIIINEWHCIIRALVSHLTCNYTPILPHGNSIRDNVYGLDLVCLADSEISPSPLPLFSMCCMLSTGIQEDLPTNNMTVNSPTHRCHAFAI